MVCIFHGGWLCAAEKYKISYLCIDAIYCGIQRPLRQVWMCLKLSIWDAISKCRDDLSFKTNNSSSVTRKNLPNVYKRCPIIISLEKWLILTPSQKLLKNVGDLANYLVPRALKSRPKSNKLPNLVTLIISFWNQFYDRAWKWIFYFNFSI